MFNLFEFKRYSLLYSVAIIVWSRLIDVATGKWQPFHKKKE